MIYLKPYEVGKSHQPKTYYNYNDIWEIIKEADKNPECPNEIILLYTRYSIQPGSPGEEYQRGWTREHCWPQSLGKMTVTRPGMGTDAHNLFGADQSINSTRSNKYFDNGGVQVLDRYPAKGYGHSTRCLTDRDSWEPPDEAKGVVARAIFYMACIYQSHGLRLGETPDRDNTQMACLSVLLEWNRRFPVTAWELRRNQVIQRYQGNTNPFILDYTLADKVDWSYIVPTPILDRPHFTQIHYDNIGKDQNEGFHLYIPSTYFVSSLVVYLYNGANGRVYRIIPYSEWVDTGERIYVCHTSLQNGRGDGLAVVSQKGEVYEFISYEGEMVATEGPCQGQKSQDIGVREGPRTLIGQCLKRIDGKWIVKTDLSNESI